MICPSSYIARTINSSQGGVIPENKGTLSALFLVAVTGTLAIEAAAAMMDVQKLNSCTIRAELYAVYSSGYVYIHADSKLVIE